ncbi:hypothetical protein B6U83_00135 [Thermoplasmatales archaeon ex4484_36]|nr:MAG: hypothetical protein B6U83_00135 [Thermoplasmatales archaeon ex4484_36]
MVDVKTFAREHGLGETESSEFAEAYSKALEELRKLRKMNRDMESKEKGDEEEEEEEEGKGKGKGKGKKKEKEKEKGKGGKGGKEEEEKDKGKEMDDVSPNARGEGDKSNAEEDYGKPTPMNERLDSKDAPEPIDSEVMDAVKKALEEEGKDVSEVISRMDDVIESGGHKFGKLAILGKTFIPGSASRLLSKILKEIEEEGRSRVSKEYEAGLYGEASRWAIQESISSFGRLFPETPYGTRTIVEQRPEISGKAEIGHLVLILDVSGSNKAPSKEFRFIGGRIISTFKFAYALVMEARNRGDYVTLILTPPTKVRFKRSWRHNEILRFIEQAWPPGGIEDLPGAYVVGSRISRETEGTKTPQVVIVGDFGNSSIFKALLETHHQSKDGTELYVIRIMNEGNGSFMSIVRDYPEVIYAEGTDENDLFEKILREVVRRGR